MTTRTRPTPARLARRPHLGLEQLEAREVPAVTIQLDFSYDVSGLFSDPTHQAILQQAANDVAGHLDANLPAIATPAGSTWSATFFNPGTGQQTTLNNPSIAANTLLIYVGGRPIGGNEAGFGGGGGYSASGSQAWLDFLRSRGPGGALLWGGSITFDSTENWFFGSSTSGIAGGQTDFYSVAVHELGHVLGIGTAARWFAQSSGGSFTGANAESVHGGPVPLSPDGAHWADGATAGGQALALDPILNTGSRVSFSSLDFAGLRDLGWTVDGPGSVASPPPPPAFTPIPAGNPVLEVTPGTPTGTGKAIILTGERDGSAQVFGMGTNGQLTAVGQAFNPFPGFTGIIRSTVADFDGDGYADLAFATGAGTTGTVRIINGKTGIDLVPPTTVLGGFDGGVFLAAGDVDRDGKAELAVSADTGGGARVSVYKVADGGLTSLVDFIAFGDPDFRGGSRVAMGDVDRDGVADLIVGAGTGGGPRVSVYNGNGLAGGQTNRLVPDFFALDPALRSGVYVSAADLDGDGYADVLYSTGNTGGPRIRVVSGAVLVANPGADVANLPAMADFFALDSGDRDGIRIAARDLDGDGKAEIIVGSGNTTNATVRVVPSSQMNVPTTSLQNPFPDPLTIDGVYVG